MKVPAKIVGKTKTEKIRSQQIKKVYGIQAINEKGERRRRNGTNK